MLLCLAIPGLWLAISFANQIIVQSWAIPIAQKSACEFLNGEHTPCTSSSHLIRSEMGQACNSMTLLCRGNVPLLVLKVSIAEVGEDVQHILTQMSLSFVAGICVLGVLIWLVFALARHAKSIGVILKSKLRPTLDQHDAEFGVIPLEVRKAV